MKSITLCLIIFITILTVSKSSFDDYSISMFITNLKNEGLFEIILSIKESYGQDLAIISCEELNKNNCGNCKKIVTEYMPDQKKVRETKGFMKQSSYSKFRDVKKVESLSKILAKKFSPEEVVSISKRIIEKNKAFQKNINKLIN